MKKILFLAATVLLLAKCTSPDEGSILNIEGTIDPSFDGYNMYFRPQPFPTGDIVDSCCIKDGKFSFRIPADSLYVGDVILSYSSRNRVEPLLVAVEPGTLNMEVGFDSKASGTPLNDTLASWKRCIEESVQNKRNADLIEGQKIFNARTVEIIKSQPNALGGFLFFMYSGGFDAQTIHELDSLKIYQYIPDVTKRQIRFKR